MNEGISLSTAEFEGHFFEGAEKVTVPITLLREAYDEMVELVQRNGWNEDKGLRILLAQGLAYAKGELALRGSSAEHEALVRRLMELESMASVM